MRSWGFWVYGGIQELNQKHACDWVSQCEMDDVFVAQSEEISNMILFHHVI